MINDDVTGRDPRTLKGLAIRVDRHSELRAGRGIAVKLNPFFRGFDFVLRASRIAKAARVA